MSAGQGISDRRLLLYFGAAVSLLIIVVGVLAPASAKDDPTPSTTNNGPRGAKAAFLLIEQLGRNPVRWTEPLENLDSVDAERSTLVLASPKYDETDTKLLAAAVKQFLDRGGRVLSTDAPGAYLLPDGAVQPSGIVHANDCFSTPEGPGTLAQAGPVRINNYAGWKPDAPRFVVEQRCGSDAVVVSYAVGKGEAIWWSSPRPLTNQGIKDDGDLRLLLASIGDGRTVIFDESLHSATGGLWGKARGLPLRWLELQTALVVLLLVLSFSRRRGPVRAPAMKPRSSPIEFAESMGDLYAKAKATGAATEAARRTLLRVLVHEVGVTPVAVEHGPEAVGEALRHRLGGDWSAVISHLRDAEASSHADISPRSALHLVQAMNEDAERVRSKLRPETKVLLV
jgi:hypothetical protein